MKFFIVFFLISCSSISQNLIKKGNAPLSHGQAAEKHWDSEMPLKRVSWYTELTMIFDLFYVDAKNINENNAWLFLALLRFDGIKSSPSLTCIMVSLNPHLLSITS